jgi:DNA mismatch endonuclease (patch repair protein)
LKRLTILHLPQQAELAAVDPIRSRIMRAVGRTNTKPELIVRRVLHAMGLRFRLHRKDLPGTPDIVLPRHRTVIFVHGCFWHRHEGCSKASTPKTRPEFWNTKFEQNVRRDQRNVQALVSRGWDVVTVWECEVKDRDIVRDRLAKVFGTKCDHIDESSKASPAEDTR